jgi:hypothetical protein
MYVRNFGKNRPKPSFIKLAPDLIKVVQSLVEVSLHAGRGLVGDLDRSFQNALRDDVLLCEEGTKAMISLLSVHIYIGLESMF